MRKEPVTTFAKSPMTSLPSLVAVAMASYSTMTLAPAEVCRADCMVKQNGCLIWAPVDVG